MSSKANPKYKATEVKGLQIAAVQMDANPASTSDRLARAERLVTATVEAGAQLTVLPELFNTGYSYDCENHTRVEPLDGTTVAWMRDTAARLGIHLAGSLMLLDQGEVFNALLLFAPDGQMWRYDKNYPWGWERGSFRASRRDPKVTVAETGLGNIGLLICWDAAHLNLWQQYAGRVDLMVICSSPPNIGDATYHFPGGDQITFDDMGPLVASMKGDVLHVFGDMMNQQAAWLGVPAVNSVGCGNIRMEMPKGRLSLLGWVLSAPWLIKYLPRADRTQISCDMVHRCKVVDPSGKVLAEIGKEDGEAFTLAEVTLAESRPSPQEPQPASLIPKRTYFISDIFLPTITRSVYRKGQRHWK